MDMKRAFAVISMVSILGIGILFFFYDAELKKRQNEIQDVAWLSQEEK
jgi:hypothetical protein